MGETLKHGDRNGLDMWYHKIIIVVLWVNSMD